MSYKKYSTIQYLITIITVIVKDGKHTVSLIKHFLIEQQTGMIVLQGLEQNQKPYYTKNKISTVLRIWPEFLTVPEVELLLPPLIGAHIG